MTQPNKLLSSSLTLTALLLLFCLSAVIVRDTKGDNDQLSSCTGGTWIDKPEFEYITQVIGSSIDINPTAEQYRLEIPNISSSNRRVRRAIVKLGVPNENYDSVLSCEVQHFQSPNMKDLTNTLATYSIEPKTQLYTMISLTWAYYQLPQPITLDMKGYYVLSCPIQFAQPFDDPDIFAIKTGIVTSSQQKVSSVNVMLRNDVCYCPVMTMYEDGACVASFCDEYKNGCFNGGVCTGVNKCNCTDEYEGAQCEKKKCKKGWMGSDCDITHCYGYTSNLPSVCSGRGKCIAPNKCHCDVGYAGHKCQHVLN